MTKQLSFFLIIVLIFSGCSSVVNSVAFQPDTQKLDVNNKCNIFSSEDFQWSQAI